MFMNRLAQFIKRTLDFLRSDDPGTPSAPRRPALLLPVLTSMLLACGGNSSAQNANDYTAFANPELVTVTGYTNDIMEPFISRDGAYLFFNDNGANKDIYYATYVNVTTFQYVGPISAINTSAVDGTPTMDKNNKFYYISTANYTPTTYDTLYSGAWNGSTVNGSAPLTGLAITTPGFINFDVEVSPDGTTLYFDDGYFSGGKSFPDSANIAIAVDSGSGFARIPNSSTIMANVNTANLEYAPAISADGLELFFTRLDLGTMRTGIYRAARASSGDPFGKPQLVSAITGFVEGPALSPDEKSLYYHKQNTATFKFELYRVTRP
jgi:hypothetical protein